jgi:hypothetical protein
MTDFGIITLKPTAPVTKYVPELVIVHRFMLLLKDDNLVPVMNLLPTGSKQPYFTTITAKEKPGAKKSLVKAFYDNDTEATLQSNTTIVGSVPEDGKMHIPFFKYVDPTVYHTVAQNVTDISSILKDTVNLTRLTTMKDSPRLSTNSRTFMLQSDHPDVTFPTKKMASFAGFWVGPTDQEEHTVAIHGYLQEQVPIVIKNSGSTRTVMLMVGYEMIMPILEGTITFGPGGDPILWTDLPAGYSIVDPPGVADDEGGAPEDSGAGVGPLAPAPPVAAAPAPAPAPAPPRRAAPAVPATTAAPAPAVASAPAPRIPIYQFRPPPPPPAAPAAPVEQPVLPPAAPVEQPVLPPAAPAAPVEQPVLPPAEPAAEQPVLPPAEPAAEQPVLPPAEPAAEQPVLPPAEPAAEQPVLPPAEPAAEQPVLPLPEPPAEQPEEEPTVPADSNRIRIKDDGWCFYRAVLKGIEDNPVDDTATEPSEPAREFAGKIVEWIREHPNPEIEEEFDSKFAPSTSTNDYIRVMGDQKKITYADYIEELTKETDGLPRVWPELEYGIGTAAANVVEANIVILVPGDYPNLPYKLYPIEPSAFYPEELTDRTVFLLSNGTHFDVVIPQIGDVIDDNFIDTLNTKIAQELARKIPTTEFTKETIAAVPTIQILLQTFADEKGRRYTFKTGKKEGDELKWTKFSTPKAENEKAFRIKLTSPSAQVNFRIRLI